MYALEVVLEEAVAGWFCGEKGQQAWGLDHLAEENAACRWYVGRARPQKVGDRLFGARCIGECARLSRWRGHSRWKQATVLLYATG